MQALLIVLFVVLAILKLAAVITWSWWIVCIPLFVVAGFLVIGLLALLGLVTIGAIL